MQTMHAMLLWPAHDGRNADDVISARRPADMVDSLPSVRPVQVRTELRDL
jgi:hypothetical protein